MSTVLQNKRTGCFIIAFSQLMDSRAKEKKRKMQFIEDVTTGNRAPSEDSNLSITLFESF